jgi:3'(2'), 5'-bisphosphate nucleotidase
MSYNKNILIEIALKAGNEILKYFGHKYITEYKSDNSPVTEADIAANNIILAGLAATNLPIISEESGIAPYSERKLYKEYWLVDPLDGTKQFVRNENEFTVNIALIKDNQPVEGVVYAPAINKLYYGNIEEGAFLYDYNIKNSTPVKLPLKHQDGLSLIVSKSHLNENTRDFINKIKTEFPDAEICKVGSSLKFCCLAEGNTDFYPRIGAISEWDIAAGHAVLKSAGGFVVELSTGKDIVYNSNSLRTPDFIAFGNKEKFMNVFKRKI